MDKINQRIAEELGVAPGQVAAAVELLGEGSTVPFIARYRKEKTGGLDDTQLRKLEERLGYLRELEDRRATGPEDDRRASASSRPELARSINGAATKVELEDLYAPFKPKRRTKAQIAREAGLEPLSEALLKNPSLDPEKPKPRSSSMPAKASPTPRPRWKAHATSSSSASPRRPRSLAACANGCGPRAT